MTRFNKSSSKRNEDAISYEGSPAYSYQDPKNELIAAVATTFLDDKYYEAASERMVRLHQLIDQILSEGNYKFLWNLFLVVRNEWNLRSVTHLLAGYLLSRKEHYQNYGEYVPDYLSEGWVRPDDMAETVAYFALMNDVKPNQSMPLPGVLKKGLHKRFQRMSEFHAGKYPMSGTRFSLKNLIRLAHPKPENNEQSELFRKIANEEVVTTEFNWRSMVDFLIQSLTEKKRKELQNAGKMVELTDEMKTSIRRQAYSEVIPKMGLFAVINNLATFERYSVSKDKYLSRLLDKDAVLKSRLLPFRFITPISMIDDYDVKRALLQALEWSFDNLELPKGKNYLIAVDTSGSMGAVETPRSPIKTAGIFGSVLARKAELDSSNKVHLLAFATDLELVDTFDKGVFGIFDSLTNIDRRRRIGYGTNGYLVYQYAKSNDTPDFDYIFFLTDMQFHVFGIDKPPKGSFIVFTNLQGYNNTQVPFKPQDKRIELSGISDKIFDYLEIVSDPQGMVKFVENYR